MKKVLIVFALLLITILGILTRFYKLGEAPAGLYIDEAAQGYNAYSILKTGKDEFGKDFPIVFRSFTDFKTPVYIYMIVPLIPIFGLTAFTVRFPSFFFSILTVPLFYFLIVKLVSTPNLKHQVLAIVASLLLAISPWHILFGRTNFECNVALFFFLAGVLFFYRGLKDPKELLISALMFAIAIPAYHSQRIVTPLMIAVLFLRHRKILLSPPHKRFLIVGLLIGFVISLPTLLVATTPGFLARASGLNIFTNREHGIFWTASEFASLYLSYFSPRNMFILGDYGPRSSFPELSTFFVWQFPFYIYGIYLLIKNKNFGELKFFTVALLLIAPIPAALTRDPYSTIRALPLVIPQLIIISIGLLTFFQKVKYKIPLISIFILVIIYSLGKLYSSVIILNEYERARAWDYGWKETVESIKNLKPNLPVVVDIARTEPYIELLFFLKFPPEIYQQQNLEVPLGQYYTNLTRLSERKIGNITTKHINWEVDLLKEQYLVGDALAISDNQIKEHKLTLIKEIYYPDKSIAFRIVKISP